MLVVSNTSPVSNLAIIGRLNLLHTQFGEIWIPSGVQWELGQLSHAAALIDIQHALDGGWIKLRPLREFRVARLLEATLHTGEAEAIALALEISADLILLDEKDGRATAGRAGLRVTGLLGVLLRAKHNGEIQAVKPELEALRTHARFFVEARLEKSILLAAGE